MAGPDSTIRKQANAAGAGFAFSQGTFFLVYALAVSPARLCRHARRELNMRSAFT